MGPLTNIRSSKETIWRASEILDLAIAAIAVILVAILSYRDSVGFNDLRQQLDLSHDIALTTSDLLSAIKDAETGQRGYLLTGRGSYLDPYNRAVLLTPDFLGKLTRLTRSRQDQARRVDAIKLLVHEKLHELQETIRLRQMESADSALSIVLSDRGNIVMDQIRQLGAEIQTVADERLARQTAQARSAALRTRILSLASSLLIFGLLIAATIAIQRGTKRRQKLIETLEQREQVLRDNQQLLQAVMDNSTSVIYVKELTGRYALVNRQYEQLFNVTNEQMTERTDYDLFTKEEADAFHAVDREIAVSGKPVEVEETIPVAGEARTFLSTKFPIRDGSNRPYAVAGISTDITERKRAEVAQALLAGIVQYSDDAIISKSLESIVTSWNAAAEKIFGYSASEMIGQPITNLIPAAAQDEEPYILDRIRRGESINHYETTRIRKDGSPVHVSLTVSPLKDSNSRIIGASKILRDNTERNLAKERLDAQVERLRLLDQITRAIGERQDLRSIFQVVIRSLENDLPIDFGCVCVYDRPAELLTVTCVGVRSEALATQLAMAEQAHIGIDNNGLSSCLRGELVYEPDTRKVDFPFPRRLSTAGLCSVVIAPLLFESRVFGVLVAARREAESFSSSDCEFLRQLSGHVALAAHQAEIHGALQQAYDDLRQTQQAVMQQERLRVLGQMASGIAHDINNALSPVALYTEALLEREPGLSTRTREYLQITQRALEDVAHTVARMQEFYRQREPQLTLEPVDLNLMAQQVLDLTRARWDDVPQRQGIVIDAQVELTQNLPVIAGIESEVREALVNLVLNAVDAMPDGGTLTLRTRVSENGIRSGSLPDVQIEVRDTGQGMDDETRRRCLEPFFTTKGERGTGLGLAMVFGVMQRHNAEMEVASAPGEGTTVRLSFPGQADHLLNNGHPTNEHAMPPRLRILVVDDDPLILKSLRETLEADGHVVATAAGGQEGIELFRAAEGNAQFAVVITDLGMPRVDGRRVASAVKTLRSSTGVILLTGWGQRLVAERDIPPHVDRVLAKPPKVGELRAALAGVVSNVR